MPAWIALYCTAFNWSYIEWISPVWGYSGLTYKTPSLALIVVGYLLAVILGVVSPLRISRPSQIIYWCLYFTVYIPSLFVPLFVQLDGDFTLLLIQFSMTSGMLLIAVSYRIPTIQFRRYALKRELFWPIFAALFLAFSAILLVVYRHNLQFASLADVYKVRLAAKNITMANAWAGYISSALSNVFNPLLIAYGLSRRKRKWIVAGFAGQVLVYMTAAMKSVLSSSILIVTFYYSLKRDKGALVPWMAIILTTLFLVLSGTASTTGEGVIFNIATITLVRTFAIPGLLVGQFQYFFENFPHTYLGHVTGISLLFPSPYTLPTGLEISSFYKGGGNADLVNANANFFAMDGIVGFGLIGIPLMGIICALLFWMIDSCSRRYSIAFCGAALTMCIISLANSSLFTTLLGGGILLWIFLFIVMPKEVEQ